MHTLISWNAITALWIVFLVYWIAGARRVQRTARRFSTVAVLIVGAALIFWQSAHFGRLSARFVPKREWIQGIGVLLVAAGVGIAIWARWHLGQFWSARVTLKVDHQLIQSGPYARVRHPIYSSLLLAMFGTALFVGEWRALLGVLLVFVAHWQKARREETLLAGQFGSAYDDYRGRTGSLLPKLR